MSQKELLEEGFSDKIRGIAKAAATGVKQAAQQGIHLDTGQLVKGMTTSYKDEQPIAVLKKELANDPNIDIVKIDKKGIKKQQATNNKSFFGRIVGPKSITLIPFLGVRYSKGAREYEGAGAGTIKEARAAMGYGKGTRTEKGAYKPVSEKGSVVKQLTDSFKKLGVEEKSIGRFASYISKNMGRFLQTISETHPNVKFSYKQNPELGVVDLPDEKLKESFSIRDILQLSSFLILEKETDAELAQLLGFKSRREMRDAFREAGGKRKWVEQNPNAVKAAAALRRRKEKDPDFGDKEEPKPEPKPKPKPEPKPKPKPEPVKDDFSDYVKLGPRKFIEGLDDETITGILKTLQEAQDGYQIKFTQEEADTPSDFQEEMFVAEIFRTKDGLKLGDIYREGDPTDIIKGFKPAKKEEKTKLSPFDTAVSKVKKTNNLTATTLASALKIEDKVIVDITGKPANVKLLDPDITKIKDVLIKKRIIKEKSSQKILLRQLTSLSR